MTPPTPPSGLPRRVAIVESNITGHRLYFVRLLVEEAGRRGDHVSVLLPDGAAASAEYDLHLRAIEPLFEARTLPGKYRSGDLPALEQIAEGLQPDHTVVPDGDRLARRLALPPRWKGPGTLAALVLREKSQARSLLGREIVVNIVKASMYRWADRQPGVSVVLLKTAFWKGRAHLVTAHDPVTMSATPSSIAQVRAEIGLDTGRHWFAVLGMIDERKNLPLVARSLAGVEGHSVGLLVAGTCSESALLDAEEALGALRSGGASVLIVNRMLGETELDSLVAGVDTVVMAHSNEGSSGLFGKAAAAGTRIVAAGPKTLKEDIDAHPQLGVWAPLIESRLRDAFYRSLRDPYVPIEGAPGSGSFTDALLHPVRASA